MAGEKILIIDDNEDFSKILQERLEGKGYQVTVAHDGEEGFKKAGTEDPRLILLDIKMPGMDGLTFVRRLRKIDAIKNTSVMILTDFELMRDLFAVEGIKDYFSKTRDMELILKTVDQKFRR